jgi:hypothetical protein
MARALDIPSEAVNGPGTEQSQNESIPARERTDKVLSPERSGPDVGEKGEYRSATYPVHGQVTTPTGQALSIPAMREDR